MALKQLPGTWDSCHNPREKLGLEAVKGLTQGHMASKCQAGTRSQPLWCQVPLSLTSPINLCLLVTTGATPLPSPLTLLLMKGEPGLRAGQAPFSVRARHLAPRAVSGRVCGDQSGHSAGAGEPEKTCHRQLPRRPGPRLHGSH